MEKTPPPAPLLTEPVPIFETFATGLNEIADCGGYVRLTWHVDRPVVGTPEIERAVVSRLIISPTALAELRRELSALRSRELEAGLA